MIKVNGFNLIELVIFIFLLAIGIGVLIPLTTNLRYVHRIDRQTQALGLAQERMELILAQEKTNGFTNFTDPCTWSPQPSVCNVPAGYSITTTIANNWAGNTNYKIITVSVNGLGAAELTSLVANY